MNGTEALPISREQKRRKMENRNLKRRSSRENASIQLDLSSPNRSDAWTRHPADPLLRDHSPPHHYCDLRATTAPKKNWSAPKHHGREQNGRTRRRSNKPDPVLKDVASGPQPDITSATPEAQRHQQAPPARNSKGHQKFIR